MRVRRPATAALVVLLSTPPAPAAQAARDVNLPLAPAAPGFVLLGVAPASVERPGNVTDLALSVLSASERFSALPRDYALAVAPYWLVSGRNLSYAQYAKGGSGKGVLLQTLSLSLAVSSAGETASDTATTSLGVGARFSLVRGPIDDAANGYGVTLDTLYAKLRDLAESASARIRAAVDTDQVMRTLGRRAHQPGANLALLQDSLKERQSAIVATVNVQLDEEGRQWRSTVAQARRLAAALEVHRRGWNVDVAGGAVMDFADRAAGNGKVSRLGIWLNGGYEGPSWTLLGVARLLRDRRSSEPTVLDLGGRLLVTARGRYSVSGEALARIHPNSDTLNTVYRVAVITDIRLSQNRAITLSFGRDFDGTRSGSLIAVVNLVLGLVMRDQAEGEAP